MRIKIAGILLALLAIQCSEGDGIEDKTSSYEEICIKGHTYYEQDSWFWRKGMLSIKLDDNGKPVKCH